MRLLPWQWRPSRRDGQSPFFKGGDTARKRHQLDAAKIADNHIGLLQCVQIPPDGQGRYAAQHAELVYLGCPVVVQIRQDRIAAG